MKKTLCSVTCPCIIVCMYFVSVKILLNHTKIINLNQMELWCMMHRDLKTVAELNHIVNETLAAKMGAKFAKQ